MNPFKNKFLSGCPIEPRKIKKNLSVRTLIENYFQAYNAGRLNEASRLLTEKMLSPKRDVTIGLTLAGALTPAGMSGMIISMMEAGFIDFIISTGANLYHDLHFALNLPLRKGIFDIDDAKLWECGIVRIYDIFLETKTLLKTDYFQKEILLDKNAPRSVISTSELHYYYGKVLLKKAPNPDISVLAQAAKYDIPVYTSSPGDSSIGMDLARLHKILDERGMDMQINPSLDVIETAAIVMDAKENGAILLGGGSPKNFYMQTQPMLWEVLGIKKGGHDYFIQITMDSPQWGGLSGATPSEAVSWGKINPNELKNTVVVYSDVTLAVPLLFSYALDKAKERKQKRLYLKRGKMIEKLRKAYLKNGGIDFMPDYLKER